MRLCHCCGDAGFFLLSSTFCSIYLLFITNYETLNADCLAQILFIIPHRPQTDRMTFLWWLFYFHLSFLFANRHFPRFGLNNSNTNVLLFVCLPTYLLRFVLFTKEKKYVNFFICAFVIALHMSIHTCQWSCYAVAIHIQLTLEPSSLRIIVSVFVVVVLLVFVTKIFSAK